MASRLEAMGFVRGRSSPSCFHHRRHNLLCVVHGDDFTFSGIQGDLDWVTKEMNKSFLCKVVGTLGSGARDCKELRVLNRVLRWQEWGVSYQADPRHAELLARDVLDPAVLQVSGTIASAATPGVRLKEEEAEDLPEWLSSHFRSWAARALYLSLDRPDLAFASKELCRKMSKPDLGSVRALVRLVRYLQASPYLEYNFEWQEGEEERQLKVHSDTDFAGCTLSRRSTSGGVIQLGRHVIKHYSSTQKVVTLSSAEAELAGIVRGGAEVLGVRSLATDLGIATDCPSVMADASAAIGICRRAGIGRVRHLAVAQLWMQEQLRLKTLRLYKVKGTDNIADVLAKHVPKATLDHLLGRIPVTITSVRAQCAPKISSK